MLKVESQAKEQSKVVWNDWPDTDVAENMSVLSRERGNGVEAKYHGVMLNLIRYARLW